MEKIKITVNNNSFLRVSRIEKDWKDNKATLEELQNAQDILDNETKIFEDLEFQHLEEESELWVEGISTKQFVINRANLYSMVEVQTTWS